MREWFDAEMAENTAEIAIFDQIGAGMNGDGVTADNFKATLDDMKSAETIKIKINSLGGNVFDGLAIYNLLAEHRDKIDVEVYGVAASAASMVALAGRSLKMRAGAQLMIHNPWAMTVGDFTVHDSASEWLQKMAGEVAKIYASSSNLSEEEAREAMTKTTWYTAEEAVEAGFAQEISEGKAQMGGGDPELLKLYANVPKPFMTAALATNKPDSVKKKQPLTAPAHSDGKNQQQGAKMDFTEIKNFISQANAEEKAQLRELIGENTAKMAELEDQNKILKETQQETSQLLKQLQAERHNEQKNTVLASALEEGRILPADREKWEKRFDEHPDFTMQVIEDLPKQIDTKEHGHAKEEKVLTLSSEEKLAMVATGLNPDLQEDVKAYLEA